MAENEKDLTIPEEEQEFSLEDIMKEFSGELPENAEELAQEFEEPEQEPAQDAVTGDTVRIELPVTEDTVRMEPAVTADTVRIQLPDQEEEETAEAVTGDTIRLDTAAFAHGQVRDAEPVQEEEAPQEEVKAEPFSEEWEPEYEQPIADYVPPRPILIHPRSYLRELKSKIVAGPEKVYYSLLEKGLGKLQIAIFFSVLVLLISAVATVMYALGAVQENRMKLMVFGQFMAMLVSALLGSFQLIDGLADLKHKRFSLNTMLVFSFVLCCVDGVLCLKQLRVPCCAAFSLLVTMSLWNAYQRRNTAMGQMDTLRKATHLEGIAVKEDYYEGTGGILRGQGNVEDIMDHYAKDSKYEKILSVYSLVALLLSVGAGIAAGVLHGIDTGIQVAAVTTLAATPATIFITVSRPMAVLERRLHGLGAALCGWHSVEALGKKAVFPISHEDLFPAGMVKLNGVKFYGDRDSDQVVAYTAALMETDGGALAPLFTHLLDSRNGIHYKVQSFNPYGTGGIGGEVNGEPVLVGTLPFLKSMGVEVPEGIRVSHAVGTAVDGELCGLYALAYEKDRAAAAGMATLCGYRRLKVLLTTGDFMLTDEFLRSKFGVKTKKLELPEYEKRAELREKTLEPGTPAVALSTSQGIAPFAYCVTGARALGSACRLGVVIHMIGGILGIVMMLVLAILGARELLTPANMFLYQLVWMIPGLLITQWTRSI